MVKMGKIFVYRFGVGIKETIGKCRALNAFYLIAFLAAFFFVFSACGAMGTQNNQPPVQSPSAAVSGASSTEQNSTAGTAPNLEQNAGTVPGEGSAAGNDNIVGGENDDADENDEPVGYVIDSIPPIPSHNDYMIMLEINPEERTVEGITRIHFTNRHDAPLETIVLRLFLNAFTENYAPAPFFNEWQVFRRGRVFPYMNIQYASVGGDSVPYEINGTVLVLHLPEPLPPDISAQVILQYNAFVPPMINRTGGNNHAMWFGAFLPVLAVHGEDGWHTEPLYPAGEPFFIEPASYQVSITTPLRYTVVGSGLRTEEIIEDTDTRITHFTAHLARDFAFALSPYFNHAHLMTDSGVDIHFYYYTEGLPVDAILEIAQQTVEQFTYRVGVYPFGHFNMVETELAADNASFPQIVFLDSDMLRADRLWGVAHGIGNQWFANVVGSNRIAHPWLSEGLTRFVQLEVFYPTYDELRERIELELATITGRTDLRILDDLSVHGNRTHYAHTQGRKAMVMLYSLYSRMGSESFWNMINQYYQSHSFQFATTDDFIRIAEDIHGRSLESFFQSWLDGGEVPVLPPVIRD